MPKLITLRGNSGSGKTSAAIALQERFGPNTMRVSHDMVRMEMLHVRGRLGVEKSLPLMAALLEYGRQSSEVTILEGILPAEDYAPLFRKALELFGRENVFAYYYDLPFEETLRRHATKSGVNFGEEDMRRWWQEGDCLPMVEETRLPPELSLEEAVERIYRQVGQA